MGKNMTCPAGDQKALLGEVGVEKIKKAEKKNKRHHVAENPGPSINNF